MSPEIKTAVAGLPPQLRAKITAAHAPGAPPEANGQILAELLAFLSTPAGQALLAALLKLIAAA